MRDKRTVNAAVNTISDTDEDSDSEQESEHGLLDCIEVVTQI